MKALALSFLLFATPIVIDTAKLPPGRVQINNGGSRSVTVSREGSTVTVRVEEGKRVDTIEMTRNADGQLSIARSDNGVPREVSALDRRPVIVDGIDLEPFMTGNFLGKQQNAAPREAAPPSVQKDQPTYYVCPKDETMVRVKPGRAPAELHCPLDGTPMKVGTGSDKQIFLVQ